MTTLMEKRRTKPHSTGIPSVANLRGMLGKIVGKPQVSRLTLANMLGAAPNSIVNWEKGLEPSSTYVNKLTDLDKRVREGKLSKDDILGKGNLGKGDNKAPFKAGTKTGKQAKASQPKPAAAPAKSVSKLTFTGKATPRYANGVAISGNKEEVLLRFGLTVPGETNAREICSLLVPRELLAQICAKR